MNKKDQGVILLFHPRRFFGVDDEAMFFEWLGRMKSVVKSWGVDRNFFIKINSRILDDDDFYDLYSLMGRYGYDLEQLRVFVDKNNEPFIAESSTTSRAKRFISKGEITLLCRPRDYYLANADDEAVFLGKINTLGFAIKSWGAFHTYFIKVKSRIIDEAGFCKLYVLMKQYDYNLEQLRVFIDKNHELLIEKLEVIQCIKKLSIKTKISINLKQKKEVILLLAPQRFFGPDDEAFVFGKLESFKFVKEIKGLLNDLFITIKSRVIKKDDFYRLYALMGRYGYDLEQMRVFVDKNNEPFIKETMQLSRMKMVCNKIKSVKEVEAELERVRRKAE